MDLDLECLDMQYHTKDTTFVPSVLSADMQYEARYTRAARTILIIGGPACAKQKSDSASKKFRRPDRVRQYQANAPPPQQSRFPFTVFGKGPENRPDPTGGVRGSGRSGQHVGRDIMRKYIVKKALVKGGMSEAVNIVQDKMTGKLFVQKSIALRDQNRPQERARAEINTLLKIAAHGRHEKNLNAIIESEVNEPRQKCFMILEFCDMGSVSDYIAKGQRQRGGRGSEQQSAWNLLAGVANGLDFLHTGRMNGRTVSRNWDPISHLDIKPANVFICSQGGRHGHFRIVLADFGCAVASSDIQRQIRHPFVQECGTPCYYPPEGKNNNGRTTELYYVWSNNGHLAAGRNGSGILQVHRRA